MSFTGPLIGSMAGPMGPTRGRMGGVTNTLTYPSPFFDIAQTYMPTSMKHLFRFCRYFFLTNGLINATVFKLSEYPITDIVFDDDNAQSRERWSEYYHEHLKFRSFQIEVGLDYFCLAGETLVTTKDGPRPIRELRGSVEVLSRDGVYRQASFRPYGKQKLLRVELSTGEIIHATPEHRWPVWYNGRDQWKTTAELNKSVRLIRTVAARPEKDADYYDGIRHGIVFGDGTLSKNDRYSHVIFYSTGKKRELARFFENEKDYTVSEHHTGAYVAAYGLPSSYKELPSKTASANYWYGFLSGFIATDGSVSSRGDTSLSQKDPEVLTAISEQAARIGISVGPLRGQWTQGFSDKPVFMNIVSVYRQFLNDGDFVRSDQREAFLKNKPTSYGRYVGIRSVTPTDREETVYCCVEPETHTFVVSNGILTGNCYGNCFISFSFPFHKYLQCRSCKFSDRASRIRKHWAFTNFEFRLTCPSCGLTADAHAHDHYIKNASGIRLIRWDPESIEIKYNETTGESTYYYILPATLRSDVTIGKKDIVDSTPQIFIKAMKHEKGLLLSKYNLFHFKRPSISYHDRGWGIPLLLPVLKDTFYLQIMKKAMEAILIEHIVPLRALFPQPGSGTSDPFTTVNLIDWKEQMSAEIARWRHDCVSPNTLVEAHDGLRRADEVHEGDLLRNHLGELSAVEKIWRRPLREGEAAYRVCARGLSSMLGVVSEGHPFYASKKFNNGNGHKLGEAAFIRAKDLRVGDYVGYPIGRVRTKRETLDLGQYVEHAVTKDWVYVDSRDSDLPEAFEYLASGGSLGRQEALEKFGWGLNSYKAAQGAVREGRVLRRVPRYIPFDQEFAWVIGMYLAEGSCSSKQILFALHIEETAYIERLRRFFVERFGADGFESRKSERGIQLVFSSVIAAEVFHSLCPGDARTKRLHPIFQDCEDHIAASLVGGLLDGDSCFHQDGVSRKITWATASRQLMADIRRLVLSSEILPGVSIVPPGTYRILGKTGRTAGVWKLHFHGPQRGRLLAWLRGEPLPSSLGTQIGVFRDGYVWHRISQISQVESEEVIGFQTNQTACSVRLDDDAKAHGTFCLWGAASANSNYIPILPLPIGQQTIGGDGKSLLLFNELQALTEHIIMGMNVPREFLQGGLQYSGTQVSLRMLENSFIGYVRSMRSLTDWVMRMVSGYMSWPMSKTHFKPFKMADDIQRKMYLFQLNQAKVGVSDTTLLADVDLDEEQEKDLIEKESIRKREVMKKEQIAMAEIQGEAQVIMMKMQAKAQESLMVAQGAPPAPGEPGDGGIPGTAQSQLSMGSQAQGGDQGGVRPDLIQTAQMYARQLSTAPEAMRQQALATLQAQSPELAQLVQQFLSQQQQNGAANTSVDMRPASEVRPPRRDLSMI